jgi:hypothetical protein
MSKSLSNSIIVNRSFSYRTHWNRKWLSTQPYIDLYVILESVIFICFLDYIPEMNVVFLEERTNESSAFNQILGQTIWKTIISNFQLSLSLIFTNNGVVVQFSSISLNPDYIIELQTISK